MSLYSFEEGVSLSTMDTEERVQELIEQAYVYLTSTTYPPGCDEKRVIRKKAKKFELKGGELYYKQRKACCLKKKTESPVRTSKQLY